MVSRTGALIQSVTCGVLASLDRQLPCQLKGVIVGRLPQFPIIRRYLAPKMLYCTCEPFLACEGETEERLRESQAGCLSVESGPANLAHSYFAYYSTF